MTTTMDCSDVIARILQMPTKTEAEIRERSWTHEIIPMLKSSGFDARFQTRADWSREPRQEKVFRLAQRLLGGRGAIVALVGIRGTGKTTIAAQIAIRMAEEWLAYYRQSDRSTRPIGLAVYQKMISISEILKSLYSDHGSINAERLIEKRAALCSCGLLIIDEKHDANALTVASRILTDILDRRYAAKKDTIIISNESQEEFTKNTDDSIISRLSEHGMIIPCNWGSLRTQSKN